MRHSNPEPMSGKAKNNFDEYMQRGDDFLKIELLRQAKNWYEKALALNHENENVKSLISECERKLAFENKVTYFLVALASALVIAYLVLFS